MCQGKLLFVFLIKDVSDLCIELATLWAYTIFMGWILTLLLITQTHEDTLSLSPKRAILLSMVLPGGGQFYTHQPIKGIIIGTGEVFFLGRALLDYKKLRGESEPERREPLLKNTMSDLFWFLGFWGYSMVDAYVSANFYQFKSKNLQVFPIKRGSVGILFGLNF